MSNPYQMFETNPELEQKGIVLDYGSFRVRVAHAGGNNKKFKNLLDARLKPYERQMALGTIDNEVSKNLLHEVYADTIVLNFEVLVPQEVKTAPASKGKEPVPLEEAVTKYQSGVPRKDGSVAPFNRTEVIRIFNELPRLFQDIKAQAENFALFRAVEQTEALGN